MLLIQVRISQEEFGESDSRLILKFNSKFNSKPNYMKIQSIVTLFEEDDENTIYQTTVRHSVTITERYSLHHRRAVDWDPSSH